MTARPAPYPADTKAKGWRFELDLERVLQSDTWDLASEVPMAQQTLLMIWTVAWLQVPCGSMPSDPEVVRAKVKVPPKLWAPMRDIVLRGWWLADDGRLYHDTIVERVQDMLGRKQSERQRKADFRAKKEAERLAQSSGNVPQMSHGTNTGQTQDGQGKDDTGTGTGTGTSNTNTSPPLLRASLADIEVSQMTPDWSPSDGFKTTAKLAGIPLADEALMTSGIAEFRSYWLTRPGDVKTQAEWEHALLKSLKHALASAKQPPTKTARKTGHTGFDAIDYTAGVNPDGTLA